MVPESSEASILRIDALFFSSAELRTGNEIALLCFDENFSSSIVSRQEAVKAGR